MLTFYCSRKIFQYGDIKHNRIITSSYNILMLYVRLHGRFTNKYMYMVHDNKYRCIMLKRKHQDSSVNAGSEEGGGRFTAQSINQGWFFKLSLHLKNKCYKKIVEFSLIYFNILFNPTNHFFPQLSKKSYKK